MHRWQQRREEFRRVLAGDQCVFPASVHDPISARIAQKLGFELGIFAGSVASLTVLGAPDLIVLTLSEFAGQAQRISRACELPVIVDADHGYGNALNVMRCVEELENAGIAALSIEDTDLPAVPGAGGKAQLIPIGAGVGKMRAAVAARTDPNLVIAGRTSAPAISDIADTVRRVQAYEAAGVDALFLVGLKDVDSLRAVAQATRLPLILGGAGKAVKEPAVLTENRVKICLVGHQPFAAATQAIYDTMKRIRAGDDPASLPGVAAPDLMKSLTRASQYDDWSAQFLEGRADTPPDQPDGD